MTGYTSSRESDLEIFLSFVGRHLGETGAIATVDLYVDRGMASEEARSLFEELKRRVLSSGDKRRTSELCGSTSRRVSFPNSSRVPGGLGQVR